MIVICRLYPDVSLPSVYLEYGGMVWRVEYIVQREQGPVSMPWYIKSLIRSGDLELRVMGMEILAS